MSQSIAHLTLVVRDYDEALAYYRDVLGFRVLEDTPLPDGKRWLRVAPAGGQGVELLLARAASPGQARAIGDQAGGRVFLFLHTNDFARDHAALRARGVRFEEAPRVEPYGTVAVFTDLYGNRWDLLQPAGATPAVDWTPPVLATARLRLRAFRPADAAAVFAHGRDPRLAAFATWPPHADLAASQAFVATHLRAYARNAPATWAVADLADDQVLGAVGFYDWVPAARRVEFGCWIGPERWGRGYATEAVRAAVAYALRELRLVRVQAICDPEDRASGRVLAKAGLSLEGTLRGYLPRAGRLDDVALWAVVRALRSGD
jgi:RimJ/RimL family protein N-acetyltransferase